MSKIKSAAAPAPYGLKIGDTLYQRLSPYFGHGNVIVGETKGTWVLDNDEGSKINKTTLRTPLDRQGYADCYYTHAGMINKLFCDKWARNIGSAVSVCDSEAKLREIAAIVGKVIPDDQ